MTSAHPQRIIDGDGHVVEDIPAILGHMPREYVGRSFSEARGKSPFPPIDHLHSANRHYTPEGAFAVVGPDGWEDFLEDVRIDATVLYAIGERKTDITRSDLDVDSPYNTRKYRGIPPGPISSPGRKSLEAALRPAVGDWLYFVLAARDGTLFFTDDYEEFLRVADESRREGVF